MEIVPGVHQIKLAIPDNVLGHLSCYLLEGKQGWIMIDTGWDTDEAFDSLQEQLQQAGIDFKDIAYILITHVHPDHFGLARRVKKLTSARIAYHQLEKAMVESRYLHLDELQKKMGELLHRHGVPDTHLTNIQVAFQILLKYASAVWPDQVLHGGERISNGTFELQVLWAPGHSPGHLCFYETSRKLLFAGDHILPVTTPHVAYDVHSGSNPLGDFIQSAKQMETLPVQLVLPAHEHIFEGLGRRIREILEHHEVRKREMLGMISDRAQSGWAVASQYDWHIPGMTWDQMPPLLHRLAITEALAHLELLAINGDVERVTHDGLVFYRRV